MISCASRLMRSFCFTRVGAISVMCLSDVFSTASDLCCMEPWRRRNSLTTVHRQTIARDGNADARHSIRLCIHPFRLQNMIIKRYAFFEVALLKKAWLSTLQSIGPAIKGAISSYSSPSIIFNRISDRSTYL